MDNSEFTEHILDYGKLKAVEFYIKDEKNKPEHLAAQKITIKEFREIKGI